MRKILFLILFALTFAGATAQGTIYGRLKVVSGTGLNYIVGGADTLYFGWNDHTFSFFDKDTNKILEFGLSDTAKFYSNLKFSSAYTNGTIYWPNSNNSYIKGNALYFLHGSEFLQAIPTQLKISASTHNYATLNSYRLLLNKAAGVFIQNDTNGVLMYGTDYAVRDEQGNRYLKHSYADSSTTIYNQLIVESPTDTAAAIRGNIKANSYFFNSYTDSYLKGNEFILVDGSNYMYMDPTMFEVSDERGTLHADPEKIYLAKQHGLTKIDTTGIHTQNRNFAIYNKFGGEDETTVLLVNNDDSSISIHNRLNVTSPTDTAVVIDGNLSANKLFISQSLQVGNDTTAASAANVGAIRYRSDANNSYCEMVMQTGAATYAWVIIKQNTW